MCLAFLSDVWYPKIKNNSSYVVVYYNAVSPNNMWQSFSATESVLTCALQYLSAHEIAQCRPVSRLTNSDVPGWREKSLQTGNVVACCKCPALRLSKYTEHCPLCESDVCVEHLEKCNDCNGIYCSSCVGFCCL